MNFQINDQLKDLCRQYLKDKEQKGKNQIKRHIGNENFSLKRKISAKNSKVVFAHFFSLLTWISTIVYFKI